MANYQKLIDVPRRFDSTEPERKQRIRNEIIVDAYGDEEVITSWYYYLEENLKFPFTAMVLTHRSQPRSGGITTSSSQVEIIDMAPLSRCGYNQMWVMGLLSVRRDLPLHFFLSDITKVEPDEERETALADWLYWNRNQLSEVWKLQ